MEQYTNRYGQVVRVGSRVLWPRANQGSAEMGEGVVTKIEEVERYQYDYDARDHVRKMVINVHVNMAVDARWREDKSKRHTSVIYHKVAPLIVLDPRIT